MTIHILSVPFDLGRHDQGMGRGPTRFVEAGIADRVRAKGEPVLVSTIGPPDPVDHEVGAAFAVNSRLATELRRVRAEGGRPLVLAGNCNHAVGVIGGLDDPGIGVIWLDAHGDYNTPDTTESGFFDGFALNMVVGGSWQSMTARVNGFHAVPEASVLLAGVRELDPAESDLLRSSDVTVLDHHAFDRGLRAVERWCVSAADRMSKVYVHVDLDVVDRDLAPANRFSPPGGLRPEVLREVLAIVSDKLTIECMTLASYDPDADRDDRALSVGLDIAEWMTAAMTGRAVHVRAPE